MYGMKEILLKIKDDQTSEVNHFTWVPANTTTEISVKLIS
jgi:hypothetical protein